MARQGKPKKRGRMIVLGIFATLVAALVAYRQQQMARHRAEFESVYG